MQVLPYPYCTYRGVRQRSAPDSSVVRVRVRYAPVRVSITLPSRETACPSTVPLSLRQSHPGLVSGSSGLPIVACHQNHTCIAAKGRRNDKPWYIYGCASCPRQSPPTSVCSAQPNVSTRSIYECLRPAVSCNTSVVAYIKSLEI